MNHPLVHQWFLLAGMELFVLRYVNNVVWTVFCATQPNLWSTMIQISYGSDWDRSNDVDAHQPPRYFTHDSCHVAINNSSWKWRFEE